MAGKLLVHLRNQWIGVIALLLVLTGGTAYALEGSNTVFSDDIVNDEVKSPDVRNDTLTGGGLTDADLRADSVGNSEVQANQITSGDVRDDTLSNGGLDAQDLREGSVGSSEALNNSLRGRDIAEPTLDQVPSALLGGFGRWTGGGSCNPPSGLVEEGPFVNCASVTVDLPAPARLLLMGQATGLPDGGSFAIGKCQLGSTSGAFLDSTSSIYTTPSQSKETVSPVAVSGVFPAGQHSFSIDCNDGGAPVTNGGQIRYQEAGIVAVAIAPS
jgi:hypothetical protein